MNRNQKRTPLFTALENHTKQNATSFHVPGHKNGSIFPKQGKTYFQDILKIDLTEISGLDDLHHPEGAIKEAQELTADLYNADYSYFLVGGSTVGNLSMILSVCQPGDKVLVQRNSHKSIMNALELAGAKPIFISPAFHKETESYHLLNIDQVKKTIPLHSDIKAIILTYPDYFGRTYPIKEIIEEAHMYQIPVLVDEAHGPHFTLGSPFPMSSLSLGADIVVHSAHKMLPAMTMGSFLHIKGSYVDRYKVEQYLQMIQSSSPSYPIMASLDLARYFLANITSDEVIEVIDEVTKIREIFQRSKEWHTYPENVSTDPLKITLEINSTKKLKETVALFEEHYIFPELVTSNQMLFIHGLDTYMDKHHLQKSILSIEQRLSSKHFDDKIEVPFITYPSINEMPFSYGEMKTKDVEWVTWEQAKGRIAMEAVTPYPPGIPFLMKGEIITENHIDTINALIRNGQHIHYKGHDIQSGILVLK